MTMTKHGDVVSTGVGAACLAIRCARSIGSLVRWRVMDRACVKVT